MWKTAIPGMSGMTTVVSVVFTVQHGEGGSLGFSLAGGGGEQSGNRSSAASVPDAESFTSCVPFPESG